MKFKNLDEINMKIGKIQSIPYVVNNIQKFITAIEDYSKGFKSKGNC